ncbi:unnamed protein product, partial [Effrenium voratum]
MRMFPFQPVDLRSALQSLLQPSGPAAVILRGFPLEAPTARRRVESEASLLGTLGLLDAQAFAFQGAEALVRDLKEEEALTWHRVGRSWPSYDPPRRLFRPEKGVPEFACALCLRGHDLRGSFVDFRKLRAVADPEDLQLLQQEPLAFFDSQTGLRSERVLVAGEVEEDGSVTWLHATFLLGRAALVAPAPDAAITAENQRLKKEIDAALKRAEEAEAKQKEAAAKGEATEKLNAELQDAAKDSNARNERAKALAQAELVNMAKVWRAQRAVEECKGIREVSQARLEFWRDALSTAEAKRQDMETSHSEASRVRDSAAEVAQDAARVAEEAESQLAQAQALMSEALRVAEECRQKEREAYVASFGCDGLLAATSSALSESEQAEQLAQESVAKREAEMQALQDALLAAREILRKVQGNKEVKLQEKERLEQEKSAKEAELQEAERARQQAEADLARTEESLAEAKAALLEAQRDLAQKRGTEESSSIKEETIQSFAMEAEQIQQSTKVELETSEDHTVQAEEALQRAEELLSEQKEESKQLEVRMREDASRGDQKSAMDA